jgi:hypothetical protein
MKRRTAMNYECKPKTRVRTDPVGQNSEPFMSWKMVYDRQVTDRDPENLPASHQRCTCDGNDTNAAAYDRNLLLPF